MARMDIDQLLLLPAAEATGPVLFCVMYAIRQDNTSDPLVHSWDDDPELPWLNVETAAAVDHDVIYNTLTRGVGVHCSLIHPGIS